MGRLEDLQAFARVVDSGSFSAAARLQGCTKSALSKQISRLEGELGAQLLLRTTRSLSTTAEGRALHEHAQRLLQAHDALEAELAGRQEQPRGLLRISAPVAFGNIWLAPWLAEFCVRHPQLHVIVGLSDRYVDLAEEGFDIALRMTPEPGLGLVARRLAPLHYLLCASPAYLDRSPPPLSLAALANHRLLRFGYLQAPERWRFQHAELGQRHLDLPPADGPIGGLTVNSSEALRAAALGGMGIAPLPRYLVAEDLSVGRLRPVLPAWRPLSGPAASHTLYALSLPNRFPSPKLRAFLDYLREVLGDTPPWDRDLSASLPAAVQ